MQGLEAAGQAAFGAVTASSPSQLLHENADTADADSAGQPSSDTPAATNYFLQYMSSRCAGRLRGPAGEAGGHGLDPPRHP